MAERMQIYKCELCGQVVAVLVGGAGELVCCNQPMKLLEEQTADKTTEKHVPVIERVEGGVKVVVGTTLHPMEEKHYIQWIELTADGKVYRQFLEPGDAPEALFPVAAEDLSARELCSVHGLWKG